MHSGLEGRLDGGVWQHVAVEARLLFQGVAAEIRLLSPARGPRRPLPLQAREAAQFLPVGVDQGGAALVPAK